MALDFSMFSFTVLKLIKLIPDKRAIIKSEIAILKRLSTELWPFIAMPLVLV
jgi:hypothetical protein